MNFLEPENDKFTIYSKSGCPNCTKVKTLLKEKFLIHTIVDCDEYLLEDKEGFLSFINKKANIEYKTFPMVFHNGNFIGGFTETKTYVEKMLTFFDEITNF
jgi:glutaredoxin